MGGRDGRKNYLTQSKRENDLLKAAMEAECLLMNFMAQRRFPVGGDTDEVLHILRAAIKPYLEEELEGYISITINCKCPRTGFIITREQVEDSYVKSS